jgi:CRISPR-associated protein Csm5
LHETADPRRDFRFPVQVAPDAFQQIKANLDNPDSLGEIHLSTRDLASGRPYIPGSAIKGALRTALVDATAQESTGRRREQLEEAAENASRIRGPGRQFEATALGNTTSRGPDLYRDPLRQLAISDLFMDEGSCCIDRVSIVREDGSRAADPDGIAMYRDMTWSKLDDVTLAAEGEARLSPHLAEGNRMGRNTDGAPNSLPFALSVEELCRRAQQFYRPRLEDELRRFRRSRHAGALEQWVSGLGERECLVRLGRHSHVECVTVGPPWRRKSNGRTRSYAGGEFPLGWAKLRFEPDGAAGA